MLLFVQCLNHEPHGAGIIISCCRFKALILEPDFLDVLHVLKLDLVTVSNFWKLGLNSVCDFLDPINRTSFGRVGSPLRRFGSSLLPFDALRNVPNVHQ